MIEPEKHRVMTPQARKLLKQLEITFLKGQDLFCEGEFSQELYILIEGSVTIHKGGMVITTFDSPDTYIGEMSSLLGTARSATATASETSRLVRVPSHKVEDFFGHSPQLALKLAKLLAHRLSTMNVKYEDLYRDSMK